jgi:hypothetical protein
VRAAYRPSIAIDLWPMLEQNFDEGDREVFEKFGPFRGNVEEIVIEHGLFGGRFWLPRVRIAHAEGTAKGGRITISIEQTFEYEKVDALPPGVAQQLLVENHRREDSRGRIDRYDDYLVRGRRSGTCRSPNDADSLQVPFDSIPYLDRLSARDADVATVRVLFPCSPDRLLNSPLLPPSIYSPSEELFTEHDLTRLRGEVRAALDMGSQAAWAPQPPTIRFGLDGGLWRYNRIEALSGGLRVERALGRGYSFDALARLGVADLEPNGELSLHRENGRGALRVTAFRRLDVANDWGNPLGLSASLNALLLGQDNGIYHRALGAEIGGTHHRIASGSVFAWRLFGEQHRTAERATTFSMARVVSGFDFKPNIIAVEGFYAGGAATMTFARGADPMGTQFSGTFKGEAAGGERDFGRAMLELRLAQGHAGNVVTAITGAAGGSVGAVSTQRLWYLGGPQTVHAHRPGAVVGDAYWLGRVEIAKGWPLVRPILFVDAGWAGDRRDLARARRNALAAGVGAAAMDGLLRVDVSRALDKNRWSFDIFVDVR